MNSSRSFPERNWNIYFDGLCPLCAREIDHYRGQIGAERLTFIDITADGFNPQEENLDPFQIHKVMHVRTPEGLVVKGVFAFLEIWSVLPRYHWAHRLGSKLYILPVLKIFYSIFAYLRPWLPRKTRSCEVSPYCERNEKS